MADKMLHVISHVRSIVFKSVEWNVGLPKPFVLWHDYICHILQKKCISISLSPVMMWPHTFFFLLITSFSFSLANMLFTDLCCFPLLDTISHQTFCFWNVQPITLNYLIAHKLQHMARKLFLLALLNETEEHVWCVNGDRRGRWGLYEGMLL